MCKCQRDRYKGPATENEKVINLREEVINNAPKMNVAVL